MNPNDLVYQRLHFRKKKKKQKSVVSILALVWLLGGIEALSWLLTFETKTLFLE